MRNNILRLRTLNKEKRKLLFNKTCKENLHLMYFIVFWCLFIASAEFLDFVAWVTTMTPCKVGRSDLAGSWTSFTRNVIFSAKNSYPLQLAQLQQKKEMSPGPYEQSTMENSLYFHIEPFAPCLEAVWFSDACVRLRLLRLPAKPSPCGVSTTCLSSCRFPFLFVLVLVVYD